MRRLREAQPTRSSVTIRYFTFLFAFFLLLAAAVSCATVHQPPTTTPGASSGRPAAGSSSEGRSPEAGKPEVSSAEQPGELAEAAREGDDDEPSDEGEDLDADEDRAPAPHDDLAVSPPAASPDEVEKERSLAQADALRFDFPVVVNEKVTAWVDYYAGRHHDKFEASLVRSGRYLPMIQRTFAEAGIPKDLAYLAHVESAFKPNAYSRAKAKGMFQFISSTGRRYGLRNDAWIDERANPEKSARAAAAYLSDLYARYGDWYLALAAYNAGEGKIDRAIGRTGSADFWRISRTSAIRNETKNYVPAILAATLIAKNPSKYGFDYVPDEPIEYETTEVTGAVDLRILAQRAGMDPETLRQLNPEFRRGQTPPGRSVTLRVPQGTSSATAEAFRTIPPSQRIAPSGRHTVRKGETLGTIARRYHVSVGSLQRANRLGSSTTIRAGRVLVIPGYGAPSHTAQADGAPEPMPATYRVRRGDTLSSIARRFRTTPAAIASANGISVDKTLSVGEKLRLAPEPETPAAAPMASGGGPLVHTVRKGETLWAIAARYQTSIDRLCALNDISRREKLYPGRRLTVSD